MRFRLRTSDTLTETLMRISHHNYIMKACAVRERKAGGKRSNLWSFIAAHMGLMYSLGFSLLYLAVLLLVPPSSAVSILKTCRTSLESFGINFASAPVSYFEVLIYLGQHGINSLVETESLLISNFIIVSMLIAYAFTYFPRRAGGFGFSPHKIVWSGVLATYVFSLGSLLLSGKCGTGTSIIGISLSTILLACIWSETEGMLKKRSKPSILRIVLFSLLLAFWLSYLLEPFVHLSGLFAFIAILALWDRRFRKKFRELVKSKWLKLRRWRRARHAEPRRGENGGRA